jgi:hypothetical protein
MSGESDMYIALHGKKKKIQEHEHLFAIFPNRILKYNMRTCLIPIVANEVALEFVSNN